MNASNKVVAIDGIIGVAKSTLLANLIKDDSFSNTIFIQEPVEKYCYYNAQGRIYNPLELFYQDPLKNGILSQMHFSRSLIKNFEDKLISSPEKNYSVLERSHFSPLIFTNFQYRNGTFSEFTKNYLCEETVQGVKKIPRET